ncbi:restriction endonuclease subunit S [Streptococcus suis]|nr:restriction endonuclease subunit S [Streptococcus suis]
MPNKEKNIPKRRFKEFENADAWELRKLGEVVEVCSGRDYKHLGVGSIPVYGTGGYMLSVSEALSKNNDAIGIGRKGTIDSPYILRAPFWTVDTLFYCIPNDGFTLEFAYSIFQNINWKSMDESTGVPSLSKNGINNVKVLTPKIKEQFAIGTFFSTLDRHITLHQRKLDKLKSVKQAYLSEMFPAEGERVPKRRFPGFTDDWELRKLGEVAEIIGGGTPSTSNSEFWDGDIDWYTPAEIGEQIYVDGSERKITQLGLDKSSATLLPANKTILFTSRAGIGKTAILRSDATTNQGFQSIVVDNNTEPYFIFSMTDKIKNKAISVASGSTFAEISSRALGQLEFMFPSINEQSAIGTFFSTLDRHITLHQRKLEKLKNLKKALLNELFV